MELFGSGKKGKGNTAITVLSVLLVVFIVLTAYSFIFVANERRQDGYYLEMISDVQLRTQRIAITSLSAGQGDLVSFAKLETQLTKLEKNMVRLISGQIMDGMNGVPEELLPVFSSVAKKWGGARESIQSILNGRTSVSNVKEFVNQVNKYIPLLMSSSQKVVTLLVKKKASKNLIFLSSRQLMLAQRIENNLNKILSGTEQAVTAADRFGRDAALFGRVLDGMLNGSKALQIKKINNKGVREKLREIVALFGVVRQNVGGILKASPELFAVSSSTSKSSKKINDLLGSIALLDTTYKSYTNRLDVIGITLGVIALSILLILGFTLIKGAQSRLAEQTETGRRNQRAILRLLDELTNLAEGDLSAHATVTEDITGAIADSVNYAIDALRSLVTGINETSAEVIIETTRTKEIVTVLAVESNNQTRKIISASASITDMAEAMTKVSEEAKDSSEFALKSVDIATKKGLNAVQSTIDGMNGIREKIQETSKRIKRLGESSQEIGDIISLITEIADQTNILALNAAIQASTAGDAGRGFAVVADEVQRLAERSSNAAKQVECLVHTIQADTNEAISSMEESTSGVVNGAKLAENSGAALDEIEGVSKELAKRIADISVSSKGQADVAKDITSSMLLIQQITAKTSEGSIEVANSIGRLATLSESLQDSVSGFKLPDEGDDSGDFNDPTPMDDTYSGIDISLD
jgi:twitching motility protein PilJ